MRQWLFCKNKSANTVMDLWLTGYPLCTILALVLCAYLREYTISSSPLPPSSHFQQFLIKYVLYTCNLISKSNPSVQLHYYSIKTMSPSYTLLPLLSERCSRLKPLPTKPHRFFRASYCWIFHPARELSAPQHY